MALPLAIVVPLVFLGALLYTTVGHGGATAYLAVLTLAGYATGPLTTTVLVLNIAAASLAFLAFRQAGHLRWRLLVPFLVTSVPAAYFGGKLPLSGRAQAIILGVALLLAAARLLFFARPPRVPFPDDRALFWLMAPLLGALLGFLAGATGIGGGIFLSPILLVMGWANVREAGAVASAFIVLNSLSGLAAKLPKTSLDAHLLLPLGAAVLFGAVIGSWAGARKLNLRALQVLLGCVLLLAGLKSVL